MSNSQDNTSAKVLEIWEAMFGDSVTVKGGNYTVDYKRFITLLVSYTKERERLVRIDELEIVPGIRDWDMYKRERLAELENNNGKY